MTKMPNSKHEEHKAKKCSNEELCEKVSKLEDMMHEFEKEKKDHENFANDLLKTEQKMETMESSVLELVSKTDHAIEEQRTEIDSLHSAVDTVQQDVDTMEDNFETAQENLDDELKKQKKKEQELTDSYKVAVEINELFDDLKPEIAELKQEVTQVEDEVQVNAQDIAQNTATIHEEEEKKAEEKYGLDIENLDECQRDHVKIYKDTIVAHLLLRSNPCNIQVLLKKINEKSKKMGFGSVVNITSLTKEEMFYTNQETLYNFLEQQEWNLHELIVPKADSSQRDEGNATKVYATFREIIEVFLESGLIKSSYHFTISEQDVQEKPENVRGKWRAMDTIIKKLREIDANSAKPELEKEIQKEDLIEQTGGQGGQAAPKGEEGEKDERLGVDPETLPPNPDKQLQHLPRQNYHSSTGWHDFLVDF